MIFMEAHIIESYSDFDETQYERSGQKAYISFRHIVQLQSLLYIYE
jgi:hypothetical protein